MLDHIICNTRSPLALPPQKVSFPYRKPPPASVTNGVGYNRDVRPGAGRGGGGVRRGEAGRDDATNGARIGDGMSHRGAPEWVQVDSRGSGSATE